MKKLIIVFVICLFVCSTAFAVWTKQEEVDDFGDKTGKDTFFSGAYEGSYSSYPSGVSNGKLLWGWYINSDGTTQFLLQEGGKNVNLSTAAYTTDKYTVKMKGANGQIYEYTGQITRNGAYYNIITISNDLLFVLATNTSLRVIISNDRGTYSLGSVDTSNCLSLFYPEAKKGPAGGWIFYDCDADNDSTNNGAGPDGLKSSVCGWRFLEAAPTDMMDSSGERVKYVWGDNGYVGTKTGIGEGKKNTEIIASKASHSRTNNAAKACSDYSINGYDDWFLPSQNELDLMYQKLKEFGGFSNYHYCYWSSSEYSGSYASGYDAWAQFFDDGDQRSLSRDLNYFYVRAIRAF